MMRAWRGNTPSSTTAASDNLQPGLYSRLIDFLPHSTTGPRAIKKKKKKSSVVHQYLQLALRRTPHPDFNLLDFGLASLKFEAHGSVTRLKSTTPESRFGPLLIGNSVENSDVVGNSEVW